MAKLTAKQLQKRDAARDIGAELLRTVRDMKRGRSTRTKLLEPIHPGEILHEEYLIPLEISINRLARDIGVPPGRISEIVNGKRGITADTALRLGRYYKVTPELWMGLQTEYDLRMARRTVGKEIEKLVRPHAA